VVAGEWRRWVDVEVVEKATKWEGDEVVKNRNGVEQSRAE
jgi:hypothetical protein